jgi:hypothetical protein
MFQESTVCQGMTLVVPEKSCKMLGFSPCGNEADFHQTVFETYPKKPLGGFLLFVPMRRSKRDSTQQLQSG